MVGQGQPIVLVELRRAHHPSGIARESGREIDHGTFAARRIEMAYDLGLPVDIVAVTVEHERIVRIGADTEYLPAGTVALHVPQIDSRLFETVVVMLPQIDRPAHPVVFVYERSRIHVRVVAPRAAALDGEIGVVGRGPAAAIDEERSDAAAEPRAPLGQIRFREVEPRGEDHVDWQQTVVRNLARLDELLVDGDRRGVARLSREPVFGGNAPRARPPNSIKVVTAARPAQSCMS